MDINMTYFCEAGKASKKSNGIMTFLEILASATPFLSLPLYPQEILQRILFLIKWTIWLSHPNYHRHICEYSQIRRYSPPLIIWPNLPSQTVGNWKMNKQEGGLSLIGTTQFILDPLCASANTLNSLTFSTYLNKQTLIQLCQAQFISCNYCLVFHFSYM